MADILDTIDGALQDYAATQEAMRWTPPGLPRLTGDRAPRLDETPADTLAAVYEAALAAVAPMAKSINSLIAALVPAAGTIAEARERHRREISAMHAEYHRRRKARGRRRRR